MHRRSPWTVPPLLGLSVALGACTNPAATFDAEQAQRRAGWAAQRTVAQESARQRREAIRQVALPPDYREQIDANFVRTLKDPDSRKVVYHGNPYGSLVCGTVNARNAYGGYTGQQIFAAFFQPAGTPADVVVFDPPLLRDIQQQLSRSRPAPAEVYLAQSLYRDCGGTFGAGG